jgi:hypothetical protein
MPSPSGHLKLLRCEWGGYRERVINAWIGAFDWDLPWLLTDLFEFEWLSRQCSCSQVKAAAIQGSGCQRGPGPGIRQRRLRWCNPGNVSFQIPFIFYNIISRMPLCFICISNLGPLDILTLSPLLIHLLGCRPSPIRCDRHWFWKRCCLCRRPGLC